jgi:5-methylcytosine-specific restriction protein A
MLSPVPRLLPRDSGPALRFPLLRIMPSNQQELPWKPWYRTARWWRLRRKVFLRDLFQCKHCGRLEGDTSLLVCDHIKPHRGDEHLFWDEANLQTLCKRCHDVVKQKDEQASLHQRGVWY